MSELPDKFEAVDPVSGKEMVLSLPDGSDYLKVEGKEASIDHVAYDFFISVFAARALIQYGRDLERADARLQALKSLQSGAMLCRSFLGDSLGAEYNASIHEEFEALGFCPWCEGRGHRLSTNGVDKMECREENCLDGRLTND